MKIKILSDDILDLNVQRSEWNIILGGQDASLKCMMDFEAMAGSLIKRTIILYWSQLLYALKLKVTSLEHML
jgi:hypothetical protein